MSFRHMDKDSHRIVASKGGKAAHAKGTAHEFTPEKAREAGRKGGLSVSQNREHMARIGSKGGAARSTKLQDRSPVVDSSHLPPSQAYIRCPDCPGWLFVPANGGKFGDCPRPLCTCP